MVRGEAEEDGGVGDVREEEGEGEGHRKQRLLEAAPTADVVEDILKVLDGLLLALSTARV